MLLKTNYVLQIKQNVDSLPMPATLEEGVARVLESNASKVGFALLADAIDVKYQDITHCSLQEIGTEKSARPLAIAVQKNSPLRKKINEAWVEILFRVFYSLFYVVSLNCKS